MTQPHLQLPVRWWSDHDQHAHRTLTLESSTVAFLLVDCDGDAPGRYDQGVKTDVIAPALHAARSFGVRVVYLHNAPGGEGGPRNIHRELHGLRHGRERLGSSSWKPLRPAYLPELTPRDDEAEFQKAHQNGFRDTALDPYLRSWGVETLVLVGFSLKSCVYHTAWAAQERNYRVVLLRDATCPPGAKEYADTRDMTLPEGGWTRHVILRLLETNVGYTATSADWIHAAHHGDAGPTSTGPAS
ncbi:isochorismatase family cysteine hydrolase [Deinococcus apachensis]|uniref:isochorismatase family cysteine hydrolase n=1 Tax=Deinococcus apachensis TaxID=309886 RepID=UPI00036FA650|nr:isochorismatase family cysteine hydrolase [Deinococcus apachensis]